jgi:hypothetical protein
MYTAHDLGIWKTGTITKNNVSSCSLNMGIHGMQSEDVWNSEVEWRSGTTKKCSFRK